MAGRAGAHCGVRVGGGHTLRRPRSGPRRRARSGRQARAAAEPAGRAETSSPPGAGDAGPSLHVIRGGESACWLAWRCGCTLEDLAALNPWLESLDLLVEGETLLVPHGKDAVLAAVAPPPHAPVAEAVASVAPAPPVPQPVPTAASLSLGAAATPSWAIGVGAGAGAIASLVRRVGATGSSPVARRRLREEAADDATVVNAEGSSVARRSRIPSPPPPPALESHAVADDTEVEEEEEKESSTDTAADSRDGDEASPAVAAAAAASEGASGHARRIVVDFVADVKEEMAMLCDTARAASEAQAREADMLRRLTHAQSVALHRAAEGAARLREASAEQSSAVEALRVAAAATEAQLRAAVEAGGELEQANADKVKQLDALRAELESKELALADALVEAERTRDQAAEHDAYLEAEYEAGMASVVKEAADARSAARDALQRLSAKEAELAGLVATVRSEAGPAVLGSPTALVKGLAKDLANARIVRSELSSQLEEAAGLVDALQGELATVRSELVAKEKIIRSRNQTTGQLEEVVGLLKRNLTTFEEGMASLQERAASVATGLSDTGAGEEVEVRFQIAYSANLRQSLMVVGAWCGWDMEGALEMELALNVDPERLRESGARKSDQVWEASMRVPGGSTLEYKYVVVEKQGKDEGARVKVVRWQKGNNRVIAVDSQYRSIEVVDNWGANPKMAPVFRHARDGDCAEAAIGAGEALVERVGKTDHAVASARVEAEELSRRLSLHTNAIHALVEEHVDKTDFTVIDTAIAAGFATAVADDNKDSEEPAPFLDALAWQTSPPACAGPSLTSSPEKGR